MKEFSTREQEPNSSLQEPKETAAKAEKAAAPKAVLQSSSSSEAAGGKSAKKERERPDRMVTLFEWAELFALSLAVVVLLMTFIVRHSPVVGGSMLPTVEGSETEISGSTAKAGSGGDVMLISNLFYTPKTGDVVVINSPHDLSSPIIKRVIATEGQTVEIYFREWRTLVDGVELEEPYLTQSYLENGVEKNPNVLDRAVCAMQDFGLDEDGDGYYSATVPEGCIFVMGDHRNNSKDSRSLGFIDERYLLGKVLLRILPFDKFGPLH